ncbi:MAG: histidine phosphatase family protein [Clostridium sp.]
MTEIYFTRHGQTVWNLTKRLQGSANSELTEEGIERAKILSERLKAIDLDCIYTSPIKRAYETALILKGNKDIDVICEEGLRELSFGEYEGHTEEELLKEGRGQEIAKIFNGEMDVKCPKGETLEELYKRVGIALDNILAKSDNKKILIVSHGMALKAIVNYFRKDKGFYKEIMGQVTLSKVISDNGQFKFEFINDGSHFNEEIKCGW